MALEWLGVSKKMKTKSVNTFPKIAFYSKKATKGTTTKHNDHYRKDQQNYVVVFVISFAKRMGTAFIKNKLRHLLLKHIGNE